MRKQTFAGLRRGSWVGVFLIKDGKKNEGKIFFRARDSRSFFVDCRSKQQPRRKHIIFQRKFLWLPPSEKKVGKRVVGGKKQRFQNGSKEEKAKKFYENINFSFKT